MVAIYTIYVGLGRVQSTCQPVTTETDFFFRSDEIPLLRPPPRATVDTKLSPPLVHHHHHRRHHHGYINYYVREL